MKKLLAAACVFLALNLPVLITAQANATLPAVDTGAVTTHSIEVLQLLVAGIGLLFLIRHVKGVHSSIKAQTLGCLYDHYFKVCRTLLERPRLRGYLYNCQRLGPNASNDERAEVGAICELFKNGQYLDKDVAYARIGAIGKGLGSRIEPTNHRREIFARRQLCLTVNL